MAAPAQNTTSPHATQPSPTSTTNPSTNLTKSTLEADLAPIQWPNIPNQTATYPSSLDEFMDRYGQRLVPSRADREAARAVGREDVWNFFFHIQPEDVRFIQRSETALLRKCQADSDKLYQQRIQRLNQRRHQMVQYREGIAISAEELQQETDRIAELEEIVRHASLRWQPHGQWFAIAVLVVAAIFAIIDALQLQFIPGRFFSIVFNWAILGALLGVVGFWLINQFRAPKERSELAKLKMRQRDIHRFDRDEPRLQAAQNKIEAEYQKQSADIAARITALQQQIEPIIAQLPNPPESQEVIRRLQADIQEHRNRYIARLGLETRLENIARYEDDEAIEVPNPLPFISPGQLQEQFRIPPPYRLPQRDSLAQQFGNLGRQLGNTAELRELLNKTIEVTTTAGKRLVGSNNGQETEAVVTTTPLSDRARHTLARQLTIYEGKPHLLHGVYYIEYLFIAKSMLIHHSFFYDFVLNRTMADRTIELFFQDIVAIEKSLEYRSIPKRFEEEEDLLIEDAPTINITLPSGDQRSFTFATHAYLDAIKNELAFNALSVNTTLREIELDPLQEAQINADQALRFLSELLRQHKYQKDQ